MNEGMINQLETMPAKALKDLRQKKQDKVNELKETLDKTFADNVAISNLEKHIETIDIFIKKRKIT